MKKKYSVITTCVALAVVLAGYFGLSLIFNGYFKASGEIYEETDNSETVQSAASESILRCAYPLVGAQPDKAIDQESDEVTDQEDDYNIESYEYYIDSLFKAASLVGLNSFSDKAFEENTIETNDNYFVIDSNVNNGADQMTAAFLYGTPYGFYVRPTAKPSKEQIKTSVEDLKAIVDENDQKLQDFLNSVEGMGEISDSEYDFSYMTDFVLYWMMEEAEDQANTAEEGISFFDENHSMYECYNYGEKHILTDGKDVVLLSSVGRYGIAVFYDSINRKFCGINLID